MVRSRVAVSFSVLLLASPAVAQEEGTVPGALPDAGSYQGSMEMQRHSDAQDQQFREQQQQQSEQRDQDWQQHVQQQQQYNSRGQSQGYQAPSSSSHASQHSTAARAAPPESPLMAAFHRGDYATCLKMLRPRAAAGDPSAESNLGYLYEKGLGVPRNPAVAASWYQKSANQGHPPGQFALGRLYYDGVGVQRDLVEAYKWMYLAGRNYARAFQYLRVIGNMLSYDQMSTAMYRAQMWTPTGAGHR